MEKTRKCVHCGTEFEPTWANNYTCSNRCRKREKDRRYRKRKRMSQPTDPVQFLKNKVKDPVDREGVPFPLTQRLPGSYEGGKKK